MTDTTQDKLLNLSSSGTLATASIVLHQTSVPTSAEQALRLYETVFDRAPDIPGLAYHTKLLDSGVSLHTVAESFVNSTEFKALYGANPSNETMVKAVYMNALDRQPDLPGYQYWINQLEKGAIDLVDLIVSISESPENTDIIITLGTGGNDAAFY